MLDQLGEGRDLAVEVDDFPRFGLANFAFRFPTETSPRPGRHAVEVRDLFHAFERFELRREARGTLHVSVDGDLDALGLRREAEGEVQESEAREVLDLDLTGRKGRGLLHAAGLPGLL